MEAVIIWKYAGFTRFTRLTFNETGCIHGVEAPVSLLWYSDLNLYFLQQLSSDMLVCLHQEALDKVIRDIMLAIRNYFFIPRK